MPKGKRGCWICGADTTTLVQVWLRDYVQDTDACNNRRQRTVDSVTRSFCEGHGVEVAVAAKVLLTVGLRPKYARGCARCGVSPTTARVQAWERDSATNVTKTSVAKQFCEDCGDSVYCDLSDLLGGDEERTTGSVAGDMSGARARRRAERSI